LAKHLFPKWAYYLTMLLVVISLMAYTISSIVISAQTMDLCIIAIFKRTYAIEFYPHPGIAEITTPGDSTSPFGNSFVLSIGYAVVLLLTVPLGYFNLDDNIIVQKGAIACLLLIFIEWFVNFFMVGLEASRVPIIAANQSQVLGTIIFNYAFVITVPSWVNEKNKDVSIQKTIWTATGTATAFYISIGLLGAYAFDYGPNQDLLDVIVLHSKGPLRAVSRICVYLFPAVALMSSIPVFCIIIRYNITESGIVKRKLIANFWAVVFPWILSILFYTGAGLFSVINWTSLFVNGIVNFVIPFVLYILSERRTYDNPTIQDGPVQEVEHFHAFPPHWKRVKIAAYIMVIGVSLAVLAVIVIDIVYLALGQNLVGGGTS